ncbi:IclR family transcriptional regulator [Nonomuraea sp. MTCD27]|uniref:IclR family transcriptional regulator n=1 Tax=Nonomuraea sp. MTCD27 TaxID=1676747 RepID=UPI0035C146AD
MPKPASGNWNSASPAPAVLRAGSVLDVVAQAGRRAVPLQDIARALGIARSSVANICAALTELRMLKLTPDGYVLGHRLVELSGFYLAAADPIQRFNDYCRLHEDVHAYTIHLATIEGLESMNVARSYGRDSIAVAPRVGQHLPANCTALGKAMLAQFGDDHVERLLRDRAPLSAMTSFSKTDPGEVLDDIREVRRRGYAINDEESYVGVYGLAVAVEGLPPSEAQYAVSCSVLKASIDQERIDDMLARLREVAAAVTGLEHPASKASTTE